MKKMTTERNSYRIRSNSSFQRTLRKDCSQERLELPQLPLQEAKTVRIQVNKKTNVPILKFGKLGPCARPKLYSVDGSLQKAMETERLRRTQEPKDDSFKNRKNSSTQNTREEKCDSEETDFDVETLSVFPPIARNHRKVDSTEPRKKKARNTVQCKVLLLKNNQFPFIGQKTKTVVDKKCESSFNVFDDRTISEEAPFEVNDSVIIGDVQGRQDNAPFISKESLHELLIF